MTSNDGDRPAVGSYYARGQLVAALRAAASHTDPTLQKRAEARSTSWLAVLTNLASGALRIGERQPYRDTPTWVTPEVVRGGFASGADAAGGPLLPHEHELAVRIGKPTTESRLPLNGHHLTTSGLAALGAMLAERRYRVGVPEESALLAVYWLAEHGDLARAATLLETIEPYFGRLRFYPREGAPLPLPEIGLETPVLPRSAHALAEGLRKKRPSRNVEAMRESREVWAPLTDAAVTLVLETVEGEPPRFVGTARTIEGGMPFTRPVADFEGRRQALLREIDLARGTHCARPLREGEVLGTLRDGLLHWPQLDVGQRSAMARRLRHRLAGFVTTYGVPGSPEHRALRASQKVGPSHAAMAHVLAERLERSAAPGEGLSAESARAVTEPVTAAEATATLPAETPLPLSLAARVQGCREAPLATLVERRLVRSGEGLALVLPQLVGPALATRFTDVAARTLYAASYRAFRQRRSLLLLGLQHQVRFSELPWAAALEAAADADAKPAVEETLRQLAAFAITAFPATPTPNKLVSELSLLARVARSDSPSGTDQHVGADPPSLLEPEPWLPLVEEVASDIFMGTFSLKFLRAAQIAARVLGTSSLYARYYGLDYERILAMRQVEKRWNVSTAPEFDAYCLELAALPSGGNPRARAGATIEQASILTTHNLAVLVGELDLSPRFSERWAALADRSLVSMIDRIERRVLPESVPHIQRMRASKTAAFAWRQMVFYLSFLPSESLAAFVAGASASLASRTSLAQERLAPVMEGLRIVAAGGTLTRDAPNTRRLLGWSVERPFLLGPRTTASS